MAKRKANNASDIEAVPESIQRVGANDVELWVENHRSEMASGRLSLRVTPSELKGCVEAQLHELVNTIRNRNAPPIDGGIMAIAAALDFLTRIVPALPDPEESA